MSRCVIFISASFSSVFQKLIDVCYFASHLFVEMIGFSVLKDVLSVEEFFVDVFRSEIPSTNYENFS